ncbi:MAG: hypothetical protein AB7P04_13100, partial [Bacteriovoracia bacterium]
MSRLRQLPALGDFSDTRVVLHYQAARPQGRFLEVRRVRWQYLPTGGARPEQGDRAHRGEVFLEAGVMFARGGQPDPVVLGAVFFLPQDEHDL